MGSCESMSSMPEKLERGKRNRNHMEKRYNYANIIISLTRFKNSKFDNVPSEVGMVPTRELLKTLSTQVDKKGIHVQKR